MDKDPASTDGGAKQPSSPASPADGGVSQLIASALAAHSKLPPSGDQVEASSLKRKSNGEGESPKKLPRNSKNRTSARNVAALPGVNMLQQARGAEPSRFFPEQNPNQQLPSGASRITGDVAFRLRAELSAQLLQDELARASSIPLSLMAQPSLGSLLRTSTLGFPPSIGPSFQSLQNSLLQGQQAQRLNALRQLASLHSLTRSHQNITRTATTNAASSSSTRGLPVASLMQAPLQSSLTVGQINDLLLQNSSFPGAASQTVSQLRPTLPSCDEGPVEPFFKRPKFPLGVDEDVNWLSEFHCFVRSELVEIFLASHEDVKTRNNSIAYRQVGLRCRFCAHLAPGARAGRSSAFPSSMRQIYQSFTMMLRDHFAKCEALPSSTKERFLALRELPSQGATDSKKFWVYSSIKVGMADTQGGIIMNERTRAAGAVVPPFGSIPGQPWADAAYASTPLVVAEDRASTSDFLYLLFSQVQIVKLTEAEQIGNRRSLRLGLPGFGCRYCCERRRLGLCRVFPARRRTLPGKVNDIYDHIRRCSLCPDSVKETLTCFEQLQSDSALKADQGGDREFFDRVWTRLGHTLSRGSETLSRG